MAFEELPLEPLWQRRTRAPAHRESLPLVEWVGSRLARGVGLDVPDAVLLHMPDGMPPALVVERFDIRPQPDDPRWLAMEDMCSVLDLAPHDKYTGTIERVAKAVRALSTSPEAELLVLLRRVLFAWRIADGDMHLKNMALLKTGYRGETTFRRVILAAVYDALTTRVFPGLHHDRMALKLGGKDDGLRRADFVGLATRSGLRAGDAEAAIDDLLQRLSPALDALAIPPALQLGPEARATVARTTEICRKRVADFD